MWSQETYIRALRFAAEAHGKQPFPGTKLPYLLHLAMVAMEVSAALRVEQGHDEELAVQCALLHDVLEDTKTKEAALASAFGPAVAAGVRALSKDPKLAKPLRMADSLRRIKEQPPEIAMVKLADRITNLQPPPGHWTKDKIARYREEAIEIHDALRAASPYLAARLLDKIRDYQAYEFRPR